MSAKFSVGWPIEQYCILTSDTLNALLDKEFS